MTQTRIRAASRLALALLAALAAGGASAQTAAAPDVLLDVKRYEIEGESPLSASDTEAALAPHLGPKRDLSGLEAAAEALEKRIRDEGFAFHRVIVPAQRAVGGVVKLQVLRFALDKVEVTGNQHFSAENIKRSVPELTPGNSPDVRRLSREMGLANEHPSKRLTVVVKESATRDAVDAEIRVRDLPPRQTFVALTGNSRDEYNTLNENTGYTRLTIGHQETNLFDRDHALTLTYTTSPDHLSDVQQYGAFYWIPLYGYHTGLQVYFSRSDIDSGTIGLGTASVNVTGRGTFAGARLTYALPKYGETVQSLSAAIDDKLFESTSGLTTIGGGLALQPTPDIRSRPLSLRYSARSDQAWGTLGGFVDYAFNLGGGSANDATAYAAARVGAPDEWEALRYGLDVGSNYGGWGLAFRLRAQYAHSPLIPGEQFGLGGVGSVRGLRDRELAGDRGHTATLEATGPALIDTLQPVAFLDSGKVSYILAPVVAPGVITGGDSASSVGVGLRWNWQRKLDVSADLAHVLNGIADNGTVAGTPNSHTKLHFSLFYRF